MMERTEDLDFPALTEAWTNEERFDILTEAARKMLSALEAEETPGRERTPERMAKALIELTTPVPFEFTTFLEEGAGGMVVQRNIPVYSLCEHHILPFFGKAHIAYIPGTVAGERDHYRIAGLSKLARTVQFYMRRLQVQERLTSQIADRIEKELEPRGVAVVLECEHFCMTMRGAMAPGATTTTNDLRGAFMDNAETRAELFTLLNR